MCTLEDTRFRERQAPRPAQREYSRPIHWRHALTLPALSLERIRQRYQSRETRPGFVACVTAYAIQSCTPLRRCKTERTCRVRRNRETNCANRWRALNVHRKRLTHIAHKPEPTGRDVSATGAPRLVRSKTGVATLSVYYYAGTSERFRRKTYRRSSL